MKQAELFKTTKIEELKTKTKDLYNKIKGGLKVSKLGLGLTVSCLALGLLIFGFQYNQNQKYIQSQQLVEIMKQETDYQTIQVINGLRQNRDGLQVKIDILQQQIEEYQKTINQYNKDITSLKNQVKNKNNLW